MKTLFLIGGVALATLAAGCAPRRSDVEIATLLANPTVNTVGTYDNCDVKYVDRGTSTNSFYIARCGDTSTTTNAYDEQVGKQTVFRSSVAITRDIQRLQTEKAVAESKERALEKLTPAEKQALGVK
jgi:hypothetical protein